MGKLEATSDLVDPFLISVTDLGHTCDLNQTKREIIPGFVWRLSKKDAKFCCGECDVGTGGLELMQPHCYHEEGHDIL